MTQTKLAFNQTNGNVVSVKDFGAVADGATDDKAAIQSALSTGKSVYFPAGNYLITSSIKLVQTRVFGEGPDKSIIICNTTHAFEISSDAGFDRPSCIVEMLGIDSQSNTCDDKYAFYIPGVGSGEAAVYNSGLTVRDVEIGKNGRMGGGFYLKDLFRCNIERVGLTDVSWMIRLVGSVVQLKASRVISNNDSAASTISQYGISTETATYSTGTLAPENCTFENCAYIRGDRGINHTSGLLINFINFDTEADSYGAFVGAQCTIRGGIYAPGINATSWTGLYRSSNVSTEYDGTIFDDVDVNTLRTPATVASSYGIDLGDGSSPAYGITVTNCRVRGGSNSLATAIRGRQLRDGTIFNNSIESGICTGNELVFTTIRQANINFNKCAGGVLEFSDDGDTTTSGSVINNLVSTTSITLNLVARYQWIFHGNNVADTAFFNGVEVTQASGTATQILRDSANNRWSEVTSGTGEVTLTTENPSGTTRGPINFDSNNGVNSLRLARIELPSAGETGLHLYDADNATLERVTVGAADSGGTGFKVLRIPN